jgi:hypothetical protein
MAFFILIKTGSYKVGYGYGIEKLKRAFQNSLQLGATKAVYTKRLI